jgi:hypothetical protein
VAVHEDRIRLRTSAIATHLGEVPSMVIAAHVARPVDETLTPSAADRPAGH